MKTFTFKTLNNKYGYIIERYLGLDKEQLEEDYSKYTILQPNSPVKDYMWSLFNRMIIPKENRYIICNSMAWFIAHYDERDGKQYNKLAISSRLVAYKNQAMKSSTVLEVEIIGDSSCSNGKKYNGTKYPIDDTLTDLPIADENCDRDFCSCSFTLVGKRDADGRLIFKS